MATTIRITTAVALIRIIVTTLITITKALIVATISHNRHCFSLLQHLSIFQGIPIKQRMIGKIVWEHLILMQPLWNE